LQRFDKYWIGIVLGLILPALFMVVYIDHFHLWYTFRTFGWGLSQTFSKLLQVSVFPNLALVFVFYTTDTWRLSKGVLIGAMPYIIAAIACTL
jgi:hypothetical protein